MKVGFLFPPRVKVYITHVIGSCALETCPSICVSFPLLQDGLACFNFRFHPTGIVNTPPCGLFFPRAPKLLTGRPGASYSYSVVLLLPVTEEKYGNVFDDIYWGISLYCVSMLRVLLSCSMGGGLQPVVAAWGIAHSVILAGLGCLFFLPK